MSDHDRAAELLPWLANGRLQGDELAWLNAHLVDCAACRGELAAEERVRAAVATQPTVEFAPQASFNRLWERIETDAAMVLPTAQGTLNTTTSERRRWWGYAIAAQLLVAGVMGVLLWQLRDATRAADYRTVTSPVPVSELTTFQVVFDDAVTLADVKEILGRVGASAVSGPTPAGVYTLQPDDQHRSLDPAAVLGTLRSDPRVRFAEVAVR